ncbi:hypothetical protein B0A49_02739 [Cryomyces minteri]|uniref:Uncharacterized protein n=1 Tax=Cryomyces minteri TaxID=331657 RepID=A0A4U0XIE4_9PEZI|nr:hypothetical protein B0A49_02739 [Cryomyces minteri]
MSMIDPHLREIGCTQTQDMDSTSADQTYRAPLPSPVYSMKSRLSGYKALARDQNPVVSQLPAGPSYSSSSKPAMRSLHDRSFGDKYHLASDQAPSPRAKMLPPSRETAITTSPPYQMLETDTDTTWSSEPQAKRMRLSPRSDPSTLALKVDDGRRSVSGSLYGPSPPAESGTPSQGLPNSYSPYVSGSPLTPASSNASEESGVRRGPRSSSFPNHPPTDLRRLSVNSLLSPSIGDNVPGVAKDNTRQYPRTDSGDGTTTYGFDHGQPDLDTPKNNDADAISILSPSLSRRSTCFSGQQVFEGDSEVAEFGFGLQAKDIAFERGGYYARPVPINIPVSLEPLPKQLVDKPMNLLYFHHFLNHTARILVPHDCPENPFRNILPQMAVRNENLLNLLLAFSASHRARLLNHPEPANRIALWVQDVFPTLRRALDDSTEQISNANLATAIMLASMEIISPNTFEVPISWQNHLNIARQIVVARGGPQSAHRKDKVSYFLSRWFAYLDVLGSLSGSKNGQPLSAVYWSNNDLGGEDDFQIDCLLGFTSHCIGVLASIAELARQCDMERIDSTGTIRTDWRPSSATIAAAEKLKADLREGREHVYKGCMHRRPSFSSPSSTTATTSSTPLLPPESEVGWDSLEVYATNAAFHWAGLIHLNRRVLGRPSTDPEVQNAVREIVGALYKVRPGSTAEACLLFPMFTAGCDAQNAGQREKIMTRLKSVEGCGMTQVRKARRLMQRVWDSGRAWETLVTGEFFG